MRASLRVSQVNDDPPDGRGLAGLTGHRSQQVESPNAEDLARPLAGGKLLAAISTSIVAILREHYGRGPMKAKTYALDDIIVVVMRGSGFTPLEQTIMNSGEPARVVGGGDGREGGGR